LSEIFQCLSIIYRHLVPKELRTPLEVLLLDEYFLAFSFLYSF
jgi:hypothetical protein